MGALVAGVIFGMVLVVLCILGMLSEQRYDDGDE